MDISQSEAETTCSICYAEFLYAEDLKVHMTQRHESNDGGQSTVQHLKNCDFCKSGFSNVEDYAVHLRNNHVSSLKCCQYCTRLFTNTETLLEHHKKHRVSLDKQFFSCSQCKQQFKSKYALDEHEYMNHSDANEGVMLNYCFPILSSVLNMRAIDFFHALNVCSVLTCKKCSYVTVDVEEYLKHLKTNNCRSLACENCFRVYQSKKSLYRHVETSKSNCALRAEDIEKFCRRCNMNIPLLSYENHLKSCTTSKCSYCYAFFKSIAELQAHQSTKHPKSIVMTMCKFCRKEFVGTVALEKHMNRIHKRKLHLYKYKCVHCEERYFMHPKDLFAHLFSKHTDLKPFHCEFCDEDFRIRKKFTIHIKIAHKSEGFVEFDDKYNVYFKKTKSANPFTPTSLFETPAEPNSDNSQTEVETDAQTDAQTDVQTETEQNVPEKIKITGRKPLKIRIKEDKSKKSKTDTDKNTVSDSILTEIETEIEGQSEIETETKAKVRSSLRLKEKTDTEDEYKNTEIKPKKLKINPKPKSVQFSQKFNKKAILSDMKDLIGDPDASSEDEPLLKVKRREKLKQILVTANPTKKLKGGKRSKHMFKRKFTCKVCKKYCYTFQNYHNHLSLHFKGETKKCIKCQEEFSSRAQLLRHIEEEHKTSRLTDTLKNLLEKKKQNPSMKTELTQNDRFQRTIKKVMCAPCKVAAKITEVKDKLSVKNFLESFVPEDNIEKPEEKLEIDSCVSVRALDRPVYRESIIKMTKFVAKPERFTPKLSLPVPFKPVAEDKPKVSVKIIQDEHHDINHYDNDEVMDHYEEVVEHGQPDTIVPDVAEEQEVTAETVEKQYNIPHTLVLPKDYLKSTDKIRIAHMLPEKPFYKIIKMEDVLKEKPKEPAKPAQPPKPIRLPDGTKLVNVNPLAHLLNGKQVDEIIGRQKYKPKTRDMQAAIANALTKLDTKHKKKLARSAEMKTVSNVEQ